MQRQDLRTTLRGWLQDGVSAQWTDTTLNRVMNFALREVEKTILGVDPEAFKCIYYASITATATGKDALYAYPAGTWGVIELATSEDATTYYPLSRLSLPSSRTFVDEAGFVPWSKSHFMLYPPPARAINRGLRIIVAPTLVMAEDTDENPLPNAWETMLLKVAQKYALADVGEPTDKIDAEIEDLKKETPRFYFTATEPSFLTPMGYEG